MLHHGDCLDVLATLAPDSVDAVVSDPPYGIHFMGAMWDRPGVERWQERSERRQAEGKQAGIRFVGGMPHTPISEDRRFQAWTEQWAALAFQALKPGGALLAMGATRLFHRTACGIQDAGFEMRDCLAWIYGSGFPKSRNDGPRGTALKPAWEPVVVARKPLDGTHAANYARWGTGYFNIDDARVPLNGDTVPEFADDSVFSPMCGMHGPGRRVVGKRGGPNRYDPSTQDGTGFWSGTEGRRGGEKPWKSRSKGDGNGRFSPGRGGDTHLGNEEGNALGRWPANVAHDGSDAVMGEFPHTVSGAGDADGAIHHTRDYAGPSVGVDRSGHTSAAIGDEGSAARFFYTAKPSRSEKEAGLEGMGQATNPHRERESNYQRQSRASSLAKEQPTRACTHPTVKPIELFRWLIRLACPPSGIVLDPFLGSGTTAIAALLEQRSWIGIERETEYAAIAEARIDWWAREAARKPGRSVAEILGEYRPSSPKRAQGGLFE